MSDYTEMLEQANQIYNNEAQKEGYMKGNNALEINQLTMIEAVQCWVNTQFNDPPKVKSVKENDSYSTATFVVELESPILNEEQS
jgi:hypothetical protein